MKKENIIRFAAADFEAKRKHFKAAGHNESQTFTLFTRAVSPRSNIFIGNTNILPDPNELRNQSSVSIEPTRELQAIAYSLAYETGKDVGDEHSHPFTDKPQFIPNVIKFCAQCISLGTRI